jgi:putative membrane-bound dehydrogenase-like protein
MAAHHLRRWSLALLLLLAGGGIALHLSRPGRAASDTPQPGPSEPPFKVPPGFVVERVAGPPLVEHPVMAGFDDRGRLYVAESAGQNLKADQLLKELPNSIRRLEDTDGDGIFDRHTVFADKMSFPMGVLWHEGSLYTCSPPSLWRLQDTQGTGVADVRQELVTKFGFTGNAADIHGPFLGPDGRLYWADGRHGHEINRPDGSVMKGKAARIFRCKLDGTEVETVCGGGMDNPVEVAFTAEGEPFATTNILIGSPRQDAIIYCIEGGVYPRHEWVANQLKGEFKLTGDLLPPVVNLGWVAPSGLMRYRSGAFGKEYRDNLFSAQFNTHRIQRHILQRDGASFRARSEDFLVSTSPDFHPTDVLEDADGSLLVVDTGGWFRIGCPTSQIAKPDIKGAIYRVRKKDAPRVADPWGRRLAWSKLAFPGLARLLNDPRWAVRDRAVRELARPEAVGVLQRVVRTHASPQARRNAVWALTRIDAAPARARVRLALNDADVSVRLAAIRSVGLHRDELALPRLRRLLNQDNPAVRRQVALALARLPRSPSDPVLVEDLLRVLGGECDRFLEHALIHALIQIQDREHTLAGLRDASPRVRRGALIALDQINGGDLTRDLVVPLLDTDDAALQQTVWGLITARPEWASEVTGLMRDWAARPELPAKRRDMLRTALLAFCKDPTVQELAAQALAQDKTPNATRLLLLGAFAQAPLDKLPAVWIAELGRCLNHRDEAIRRQAVTTMRVRGVADFDDALLRLAHDAAQPTELRVAALSAAAPRLTQLASTDFAFLGERLDREQPPLTRLAAAGALGSSKLSDAQLMDLTRLVATAGAMELPYLVAAYEHSKNPRVGLELLAAVAKSPGLESLAAEYLRRTLKDYPVEVHQAAGSLLARLEVDTAKQKARLDELEPILAKGDSKRGQTIFFGTKAACSTCHTAGTNGGRVGPDLTKIGTIRSPRDLLEAVVFPSASFVRGFEPYVISTRDGRFSTGIIGRDTADAIYLVTAERNEIRIPRSSIETIERGKVSIMPQGLDGQLSRQELGDLIAFLRSLR